MQRKLSQDEIDSVAGLSSREAARQLGVAKTTINEARRLNREGKTLDRNADGTITIELEGTSVPQTAEEIEAALVRRGVDKTSQNVSYGFSEWDTGNTVSRSFKATITPKSIKDLEYVPLEPAQPVIVQGTSAPSFIFQTRNWKTAVATADHQINTRTNGEEFHDTRAISIASQIIALEKPDQILYCGDFLDLPEQGRWSQESSFYGTTQGSIDYGHRLLAIDRDVAPDAEMVLIEGNHDMRMQKFMTLNATSAQGIKRAGDSDGYPVMSLPFLMRLDELRVNYIDAYPAGVWWVNDKLRAIHGDRVRSNGSTATSYANATPHISTIFGHTHRAEILSRTTFDRAGRIKTHNINPGVMCHVDGKVPGVNSAVGLDGRSAVRQQDWQQGLTVIRYKESGEFFFDAVQIEEGFTIYQGQEIYGTTN